MQQSVQSASRVLLLVALGAVLLGLPNARSHEIPNDVTVQVLIRPEAGRLGVLIRAPLEAMRDINFPVTGPGYLDFGRADQQLRDAAELWLLNDIKLFEAGDPVRPLELSAVRASIPSDRSFRAYDSALAHVRSPALPSGTPLVWQQAMLDVLLEAPIKSTQSEFAIDTRFERLGLAVITVIRYFSPEGVDRVFEVSGNSGVQPLDPGALQAAFRFLVQGFDHILDGLDHLLFLLCLVMPFHRQIRSLIWVVTAFTVAHSATLIGSAYGLAPDVLWFPPFVEILIAASILYMAIENVLGAKFSLRWGIAFAFGLVHGFGFSFALRNTLQFAGDHVLTSLLSFNIGVELGQILMLMVFVIGISAAFRYVLSERAGIILVSVLVGHTAWHWLADRWEVWRAFDVSWMDLVGTFTSGAMSWFIVACVILSVAGILVRRGRRTA